MTRINCVPVSELVNKHLIAEYRELPRVRRAYPRKSPAKIPPTYRMGTGHATFFYDKGVWLERRHLEIIDEMKRRGITVNFPPLVLSHWDKKYMNDWQPEEKDIEISRARIAERILEMNV